MKIFGSRIDHILGIYKKQGVKGANKPRKANEKDSLNISETAKDFQFAMNEIKKLPDIRTEKVDKIKQQIKSGTYEINAEKIAEKIYQSANIDIKM